MVITVTINNEHNSNTNNTDRMSCESDDNNKVQSNSWKTTEAGCIRSQIQWCNRKAKHKARNEAFEQQKETSNVSRKVSTL